MFGDRNKITFCLYLLFIICLNNLKSLYPYIFGSLLAPRTLMSSTVDILCFQ